MAVLEDGTTPFLLRQGEVGRPGCLPEISDVHSDSVRGSPRSNDGKLLTTAMQAS
jgi:hypothetical protein